MIERTADLFDAAGWEAMARDFRNRPEMRERIAEAMIRNITRDNREAGEKLAHALRYVSF